jgi:hypothetical protein
MHFSIEHALEPDAGAALTIEPDTVMHMAVRMPNAMLKAAGNRIMALS